MSLCPDAAHRDSLSDDDFWQWVLDGGRPPEDDFEPDEDHLAEYDGFTVETCVQCQRRVYASEYDEAAEMTDARVVVCDECTAERFPYADEEGVGMGMVLINPAPWDQLWMYEQYLERTAA